jgi:anhydro-N-acetylmuramic acid kinase
MRSDCLGNLAWLDRRVSHFFAECLSILLAQLPRTQAKPDLVVLNRLNLWTGTLRDQGNKLWGIDLGDPQVVATHLKLPVLTDFVRHDILRGGVGIPPTLAGDLKLARRIDGVAVFLNLGVSAHLTVVEPNARRPLVAEDIGPGTSLINIVARHAGCKEGFDRDGEGAGSGTANAECLERLVESDWLQKMAQHRPAEYAPSLIGRTCLAHLSDLDRLATVTALTARQIAGAYKQLYSLKGKPRAVWVSGGGAKNRALMEYLAGYFSPVDVKNVGELGIPPDSRIPLSLGLTVLAYLDGDGVGSDAASTDDEVPLGKLILP